MESIFPRDEELICTDALTRGCHLPATKRKLEKKKLGKHPGSNFSIRIQILTDSLCHAGGNVAARWLPGTQNRGQSQPRLACMRETQESGGLQGSQHLLL